MNEFDFEELVADMLGVRDEHREDDSYLENLFYEKFDMDMEQGYKLAKALLHHTPIVQAGLSGKAYHAFVSKTQPVMLMRIEANL
ncbi:hypothetical protein [Vibrio cholerae]|uniref:hypothetical protein n=1 Tax=Vibrio cholerae TaxID=666 RepID=UPI002271DB76|nr:hypothetical protein [Vibrio cholerae]MCX9579834.1 hypothetical protein [Vibrio cholerae]